ncbi:MAG: TraR/DksA family transcriptional regulator [Pyrinomonadaceae bacterium]
MDIKRQEKYASSIKDQIKTIEAQLAENDDAKDPIVPDAAIGRLSRVDAMQNQQMRLALQRNRRDEIARLQNALKLIEVGQYGTCNACEKDIPEARLIAVPDAQMCVPCLSAVQ